MVNTTGNRDKATKHTRFILSDVKGLCDRLNQIYDAYQHAFTTKKTELNIGKQIIALKKTCMNLKATLFSIISDTIIGT